MTQIRQEYDIDIYDLSFQFSHLNNYSAQLIT